MKISQHIVIAAAENLQFDIPEFLRDLDQECSKVKRAFRHQVVSFENEMLVKRYFHFHQESLVDLINELSQRQQCQNDFVKSVLERLSGLLSYLEEHFPEYFNQDMKMPCTIYPTVNGELHSFFELITERFAVCNVDIGLIELVKTSISNLTAGKGRISFREFYYLKILRINVESVDTIRRTDFDTLDFIKLLMHCNFNAESFYNYVLKYIRWAVEKVSTVAEKLDQLSFYLKFSNQETCNGGLAFNVQFPPINIQISDWISQEVMYLKSKQQLSTVSSEDISITDFKLSFDISVSHLAYLFRSFIESGIIQNKNVSELIRFLTKYAKTKKSESISYESFRIKYYSVESGTKDAVKKMLQTVLNFINKN